MANPYFRFKQFTINQHRTAMKVSTDACIFGAWTAGFLKSKSGTLLDIGTGTGLLSLMVAQENPDLNITAIEPEKSAFEEAQLNFTESGFPNNFEALIQSLQQYQPNKKFDFIICNPPFFENQLASTDNKKNLARHDSLPMIELAQKAKSLIKDDGLLAIIYPHREWEQWAKTAKEAGWHLLNKLNIQPTKQKNVNRVCGVYQAFQNAHLPKEETLTIHGDNGYTESFQELLKPYYLYL